MLSLSKPRTLPDDQLAWVQLIRSPRVGPVNFHRLLKQHGSAQAALAALPELAAQAGVRDYAICPEKTAAAEFKAAKKLGAKPLYFGADDYPSLLLQIPDAPPILWAIGDVALARNPAVALVGGRTPSALALRMAKQLALGLHDGQITTVSGLARGIDTAVHDAIDGRGGIAVLPCGLGNAYPAQNTELAQTLRQNGLILSEHPIDADARKHQFISRNRIIAGLVQICVVVEAAYKSGSLNCAQTAADYGREVLAVPGHPLDPRCAGSNQLLKNGAGVVTDVQDIMDTLRSAPSEHRAPAPHAVHNATTTDPAQPDLSAQIEAALHHAPMREEALCRKLGAEISTISAALLHLRMAGKIHRDPAGVLYL